MSFLRCSGLAFLVLLAAACDRRGTWGTPEYFERIVAVQFTPVAPVIRCQQETGFDYVAFRLVRMPADIAEALEQRSSVLPSFPEQLAYERERMIQHWTRAELSTEAREALEFALSGATAAVDESRCDGIRADQVRKLVVATLAKPTTWHSYQFKSLDGRVLPEALEFRVLDPIERVLYELVNFS
jgi:hypothetical protein